MGFPGNEAILDNGKGFFPRKFKCETMLLLVTKRVGLWVEEGFIEEEISMFFRVRKIRCPYW
jgi:hypothetical protein